LVSELLAGKLDFIVCPMLDGALDSSLDAKIISRHQSVIVARAGHPLRGATRLRDLVDCDWAVCGPLERGDASLAAMFRSVGMPRPNVAMICESFVDALAHVATSDLLSLCPPAGSAIEQGKVISISVVDQPPVQEVLLILWPGLHPLFDLREEREQLGAAAIVTLFHGTFRTGFGRGRAPEGVEK